MNFEDLNLESDLLAGIRAMGFDHPTPIQNQAIPKILEGKDLIACAQTGTGKTAAFVLPLLNQILKMPAEGILALILVPTRELAVQIDQQVDAMSFYIDVRSIAIYGGGSGEKWIQQKKALTTGVDMIIATPGRLLAQMKVGKIDFSALKFLVLDEADRMLDMGFLDDILSITKELPTQRQTMCFSATMPQNIRTLTHKIMYRPEEINIAISKPAEGITQIGYLVEEEEKLRLLIDLIKGKQFQSVLLFSSSKEKVKRINRLLHDHHISSKAFHSDLEQKEREELMQQFKNHHISVLVGTDILSRGIDVEGIDLVVNFDVPHDPEDYVHRIGRTARADSTGTAITFIGQKDLLKFHRINQLIGKDLNLKPLPDGYSTSVSYNPSGFKRPAGGKKGFYHKRSNNNHSKSRPNKSSR